MSKEETAKNWQSITLPSSTTGGGKMHIFMVGTRAGINYRNNIGISDDTSTTFANLDAQGNSYSLQALKTATGLNPDQDFFFNGIDFPWTDSFSVIPDNFATTSSANTYASAGQTIAVTPVAQANTIAFLGAATDGNATITFTDGTTQPVTLNLPNWIVAPAQSPYNNVNLVALMPYENKANGQANATNVYLYEMEAAITSTKTMQSVALPTTVTGGQLHIFSVGTRAGSYNNAGVSDDNTPYAGNFDNTGNSYSQQALQSYGLAAGQTTTINGINFTWPNVTSNFYNNYQASGQIIPVTPVANATTLGFLGATSGVPNGPLSGTATITYTDHSTQTFTLGFEDWCSNTISALPNGSSVVATLPYRNIKYGQQTATNYIYTMSVALQAGKTVQSVTLPTASSNGAIHIFSIGTK